MRRVTTVAGSGSGVSGAALLKELKKQVTALEDDLRERSESVEEFRTRLEAEYARARDGKRTAATYGAWRDERVTQAAAAWVLGCVFVRFCEDNRLIEWPYLAGPGDRLRDAEERHEAFFREKPHLNNRDWLEAAFQHLAESNETAAGLFDRAHNPLWGLTPSYEAATELLSFWRRRGADGEILYDFTDPEWDTRFLGDLYQDLSEHARKTYALLQTPEFVEEFILDLTLEPAIEEFGLAPEGGLRTIDPACGSGHFLLGIFGRLVEKWRAAEPGTDEWALVRRALESVHGCDKNPFAVSIARFRLLVAAMKEAGARRLAEAPVFPINVAVGDSLLHGRGAAGIQTDLDTLFAEEGDGDGSAFQYATEDVGEFAGRVDLLGRASYHVVVGNPPYITVKDKQENENYRAAFDACAGKYALSVPFAQRLFELSVKGAGGSAGGGGYVGQITANSFMKREFGKKLIEDFFRNKVELSHVVDTSGAYIPGHGTPTVILVGRNRVPNNERTLRAVLGVRGEPLQPEVAEDGVVWQAIVGLIRKPGSESEWVSVEDAPAVNFAAHPWSVSGGGAGDVFDAVVKGSTGVLGSRVSHMGFAAITAEDDAFFLVGRATAKRLSLEVVPMVAGDVVRDFGDATDLLTAWPYSDDLQVRPLEEIPSFMRHVWPRRRVLQRRKRFGIPIEDISSLQWYEYGELYREKLREPLSITFAFVSTHNHFALDRGGSVFNRSAPVIKLSEKFGEDANLELLGVLNSSTACFWLKQVSQDKGNRGGERSTGRFAWESFYEFTGTKLQEFPLPDQLPLNLGRVLDGLSQELVKMEPFALCEGGTPSRAKLDAARTEYTRIRQRMIALQEELDWQVYGLYGLLSDAEISRTNSPTPELTAIPEVHLGERAFELVIAEKAAVDEAVEQWFVRHDSLPITTIPARWPSWYREIVQARIDIINSRKGIALIERPECKRRWAADSWEKKEKAALRTWLLDRIEEPSLWFALRDGIKQPRTLTVSQLADALRDDTDFNSVAQLYAADHMGKPDLPLADVLAEVVDAEHVPYLAALRYKDAGLRNREQWEQVWELQREEDRTGQRLDIPVPPKYKGSDFLKQSYWSNRGKLDVPKERFISYLGASPDADPTILLGWAGWDHKDQAQALFNLVDDRTKQAGWDTDRIKPLLAGLLEVMPWVRQWHGEYDEEWEGVPADEYQAYFEELCAKHQVSEADLRAWRPEKTRAKKKTARKEVASAEQPALGE
ncbi:BREX-2 system adenine-specific DNA-methyltransferase PglX [Streptomyces sp. NPDC059991]|uniref:BREX-2 system adenine-specific DNA-methyltransferase PglX n=1 Tax=Streptomyces sp. NPDC059991 TaxID=3347028 RepID=UPI0036891263